MSFFTDWMNKALWKKKHEPKGANLAHQQCLKMLDEVLEEVLDNEATDQQYRKFKNHIDACADCYQIYNLDKAIKELIKVKCNDTKVPSGLVGQIKSKISETTQS